MSCVSYEKSLERITNAVQMKKVDKIPVSINGPAFIAHAQGMSIKDYISDFPRAVEETINFLDRIGEVESVQTPIMNPYGQSRQWLSPVAIPGVDLPDDELWQIKEAETMKQEEYEKVFEMGYYSFIDWFLKTKLNDPDAKMADFLKFKPEAIRKTEKKGYVVLNHASLVIPFETFCGGRSLPCFLVDDLIEEPELVDQAFEVASRESLEYYRKMLAATKPFAVWVGGWRSSPKYISPPIFDKYVWPDFYAHTMLAIEYGAIPVFHLDGSWELALEYFNELPAGKCIMGLDGTTDIRKAREILGDRMCLMGDVPATKLAFGTPDEVYSYVRSTIEDVGEDTGLIICSGCDIPANGKYENVQAMVEAAADCSRKLAIA